MKQVERPLIGIAGPTASGKSALGIALAQAINGVLINADSMQMYAELDILTARPDPAELAAAPHRLYGVWPAAEAGSAARWRSLAEAAVRAAWAAGEVPILVGGTGLYFRALLQGLAAIPPVPDAVREAARARLADLGAAALHAELARRDPVMAARLRPSDGQRLVRALEVLDATGLSLAAWQAGQSSEPVTDQVFTLVLEPPREALYAAIDRRFAAMLDRGALAEVERLVQLGLDPALPVMKALGVPELAAHLRGETTLEAAADLARHASRRYAKRQTTWFRHQLPRNLIIDELIVKQENERLLQKIFPFIRSFLLTGLAPPV